MQEWIFRKMNMILIRAQTCIKTGMSIRSNLDEPFNHNIIGKHRINAEQKSWIKYININRDIGMCKKLPCMYSGIGAAASKCFNFLPANCSQCFINQFLNRKGILLDLPAMIDSSIISQFQEISLNCTQSLLL